MTLGVPREISPDETRVGLLPEHTQRLTQKGHTILVESQAGAGAGILDKAYQDAGAEIVQNHKDIFHNADLLIKIQAPTPEECPLLHENQTLFCFSHLLANKTLTDALITAKTTCLAYENLQRNKEFPILAPMSEIAGRMAILIGASLLSTHKNGTGRLLGGASGVLPKKTTIIGGGIAGLSAAQAAAGMGAHVTILDTDIERLRFIDHITPHPHIQTLYASETNIHELLPFTDILIGAIRSRNTKLPKLLTKDMLRQLNPKSVALDISIDDGGCFETSRPTTHKNPTYVEEGITHYCVPNMPSAYALTATQTLTNASYRYIETLANLPLQTAIKALPELDSSIMLLKGNISFSPIKEIHKFV